MAGLCAPLSTLRQYPRGYLRMTRGRCGSLLLHRDGLAPSTPCRSPGALRVTPDTGHRVARLVHVANVPAAVVVEYGCRHKVARLGARPDRHRDGYLLQSSRLRLRLRG